MGKTLTIIGADFETNAIDVLPSPIDHPTMQLFQTNANPLGTALTYSRGILDTTQSATRISVNKTQVAGTTIKIKMRAGFQLAIAAYKGTSYAASNADGTLQAIASTWAWITDTGELSYNLASYDTFAFNIRYADNTTTFTSNNLEGFFDYITIV